ncbi:M48 family metallopeptidase [Hasllibacter sp. MH4015]|uniref:M48 family metallopeptidase n=1 Tax=Hasllibacter sp. MH4015 TaxID=2854029 RepID=UPI001CD4B9BB|nr:M48 family metallopeptidase [Hasllibacter sp. MH4015]
MCVTCLSRRRVLSLGVAALAAPTLAACRRPDLVSDAQLQQMGQASWDQMRREIPLSANTTLTTALSETARALLEADDRDPRDWEVAVFASPQANAFALPGNKIGVFEGMFQVFANRAQLAAVIGHEIGHIDADHSKERVEAQMATEFGLRAVQTILDLGDVEYAREIAGALGIGAQYGLLLPYSRRQEIEADAYGLRLMHRADYDPAEAAELWRRMDAMAQRNAPEFLSTHPAPEARIEAIEDMLPELA